jgi:hypothetical protein
LLLMVFFSTRKMFLFTHYRPQARHKGSHHTYEYRTVTFAGYKMCV